MLKYLTTALLLLITSVPASAQWSLDSCLHYAALHNQGLITALESEKAAGLQTKSSRAALLPTVNANAQMDYNYKIPIQIFPGELVGQPRGTYVPVRISTPWLANYGLEAGLKLVDAAAWKSIKLSVLQQQQQAAQTASYRMLLDKNVRQAFYEVQVRKEAQEIAEQQARSYAGIHQLLRAQFSKGLTDQITLNQSQNMLTDREEALRKAHTSFQVALLALQGWMGYPLEDSLQIRPDSIVQVKEPASFDPQRLPDFEAEQMKTLVAEKEWKMARSRWWPTLSANASYNRYAFGSAFDFWQQGNWYDVGTISLRLRFPLLAVKELIHEPARKKTAWQQSLSAFAEYRQEQERSWRQETLQMKDALLSVQHAEEKTALAQQNLELVLHKLEKGLISMVEVRQVTDDLYQAQQQYLQAKLDYWQHIITLNYLQNHP